MKVDIPVTSMTLIDLVKRGDEDAWFRFVDVYTELIYAQCVNADLVPEAASEVSSDVFVALVSAVRSFRKRTSTDRFHHFLRRITTYKICDYWDAKRRLKDAGLGGGLHPVDLDVESEECLALEQVDQMWNEKQLQEAIRLRILRDARNHFPDETIRLYVLLEVEDRPISEVATEVNVTVVEAEQRASEVATWLAKASSEILPEGRASAGVRPALEQEMLKQLAANFRPKTIEAYRLKTFEKMPIKIVALELAMSEGAVRVAAHRVKNWIRENLPNTLIQANEPDGESPD